MTTLGYTLGGIELVRRHFEKVVIADHRAVAAADRYRVPESAAECGRGSGRRPRLANSQQHYGLSPCGAQRRGERLIARG